MDKLFVRELPDWRLPTEPAQLSMQLSASPRKGIQSRELNWDVIREQLRAMLEEETPITLTEACQRTDVDHKLLYLRANTEARTISDRYRRHQAALRKAKEAGLQVQVRKLIQERLSEGYEGISAREVWQQLDGNLKSVRHTYRQVAKAIAANDSR